VRLGRDRRDRNGAYWHGRESLGVAGVEWRGQDWTGSDRCGGECSGGRGLD